MQINKILLIKLSMYVIILISTTALAEKESSHSLTDSHINSESLSTLQTYKLEHSVAIGSPLESDVVNIPGHLSVIDSEEIHKSPNTKITDIVKKTPGVRIDNDTSFNPRPRVKIRGINYGTLIMLDGIILSDLEGENRIINQIFLEDIQRVEIARGSYSSLYGTGAIGGVINFITTMPNTLETSVIAGYGTEFQSHTADKNLFKIYMSIGDAFFDKRLRIKFNAGYKGSEGYPSFPTYFEPGDNTTQDNDRNGYFVDKAGQTIIGTGGDRNYHIYDTRFKAEYDVSDADMLSFMVGFSSYDYTFKNFISYLKDTQGKPTYLINNIDYFVGSGLGGKGRYSHLYGNLTYTHNFEDSLLKIALSSMNLYSLWQDALHDKDNNMHGDRFGGPGRTQDTDSSSNYLDVIYQSDIFSSHKLAIGSQFRYYTYTQDKRNMTNWLVNSTRTDSFLKFGSEALVASMYVNWEAQWLDNLSTNLGVRYDYWRNFNGYYFNNQNQLNERKDRVNNNESIFSPKFSMNYAPLESLLLKASIGSGFRMPTMRDMYQFTHASNYWDINPDLKKESALSFDIGAEFHTHHITTSLYYYQLEMKDMIYRSGAGKENDPWKYMNAGKGRINGIEWGAFVSLWNDFVLEGNYTLTLAKVLENPARPQSVGKQLIGVPKHMANVALHYMPKYGLYASLWAYYTPAFYNDDANSTPLSNTYGYYESQFNLNAKIGYMWKMGLDASLSFFNLTNNRYYDFYRVAGASFYAQVGYKF